MESILEDVDVIARDARAWKLECEGVSATHRDIEFSPIIHAIAIRADNRVEGIDIASGSVAEACHCGGDC